MYKIPAMYVLTFSPFYVLAGTTGILDINSETSIVTPADAQFTTITTPSCL